MTIEEDKAVRAGIIPLPPSKKEITKRGRGRPRKNEDSPKFVSELPAPPKKETFNPHEFFAYIRSIPADKLTRVMLSFYRYLPACDITEGGVKDKCIRKIAGESHPFIDEHWEKQILHLFGCGNYGCYLNESIGDGTKTVIMCRKIDTLWDPDSFPPVLDPKTLIESFPANGAYVQWLRTKGVQLPSEIDHEKEEMEMQIGDTISKLTDTVIAQSARAAIPVPPAPNNDRVITELVKPMMTMMADANKSAIETVKSQQSANDPLATIGAIGVILKDLKGGGGSGDDSMKIMLQETMQTNRMLLEKLTTRPVEQPRTGELKEFLENMKLAREAFGKPEKDGDENGEADKSSKETLAQTILTTLPTVLPPLLGLVDRGIMLWNMRQPTAAQLRGGGTPQGAPTNPYAQQAAQAAQAAAANTPGAAQSAPTVVQQSAQAPLNPATGLPFTAEELQALEARSAQLAQYNQFLAPLAPAIIAHLNDPGQIEEDGELVKKTGYDLAQWTIDGYGRVAYESIKGIGADTLFDAIKNYQPLWSQIAGIEPKVRTFVGEFVTLDEYLAVSEAEEEK